MEKEGANAPETKWDDILTSRPEDVLPEAFVNRIEPLRLMPLYELLEELFSLFEMNRIKEQDAYLFSFFDAVTEYLQNNSSDLDVFIRRGESGHGFLCGFNRRKEDVVLDIPTPFACRNVETGETGMHLPAESCGMFIF